MVCQAFGFQKSKMAPIFSTIFKMKIINPNDLFGMNSSDLFRA